MPEPNLNRPNRPTPPQLPNRFNRSIGWIVLIGLGLLVAFFVQGLRSPSQEITITEFWTYMDNGHVIGDVRVTNTRIEGQLDPNTPGLGKNEPREFFVKYDYRADQRFPQQMQEALGKHPGKAKVYYREPSWWESWLPQVLSLLMIMVLAYVLLFRRISAGGAGGAGLLGSFGRSRHRVSTKDRARVTFDDIAGVEEAKDELAEIVEFLKNPRKFQRLGGRIPRGVLLVGEPGCGKTLLAKAIAGEADVPFFSISGSDFVEMFVGVGASRVRDLFRQAKDSAPCIIFLDEIDAVGRRRGAGFNGGGHDEREQTLNAILVEMDGFDSSDQVIVIAATNRMDVLDPALTRPGRFDRQIDVPLPDLRGRTKILEIYVKRIKAAPDVDLVRLARGTPMFSGADLAALVNEAAIAATMADKEDVEQADLEEARDKVRWGRARKSRVIDENEKKTTAYHEAGHALVQVLAPGADPLHKVSIIPRGQMGGATLSLPEKDRYIYTRSYCQALLKVCLGGRLAEEIFCNDISSGASSDIAQATELARRMVQDWGMSPKLGLVRYGDDGRGPFDLGNKEYSDQTAQLIDQEIRSLIDEAYRQTRQLLEENRNALGRLAEALIKYETLAAEDVRRIIEGQSFDKPTVGDLLDREQSRARGKQGVELIPPAAQPAPGQEPLPDLG